MLLGILAQPHAALNPNVQATKWRLLFSRVASANSGGVSAKEIQLRETVDGDNLSLGGIATASHQNPSNFPATAAADNRTSTSWAASTPLRDLQWWQVERLEPFSVTHVTIYATDAGQDTPRAFDVQYWNGSQWVTSWSIRNSHAQPNGVEIFTKGDGATFGPALNLGTPTTSGNWTWANGVATGTSAANGLFFTNCLTEGKLYELVFDYTRTASNSLAVANTVGGNERDSIAVESPSGYRVMRFVAGSANFSLQASGSVFTGTISNITVREIIINPSKDLGPECLADPEFNTGAGWVFSGGWSLQPGRAQGSSAGDRIIAPGVMTPGKVYELYFHYAATGLGKLRFKSEAGNNLVLTPNLPGSDVRQYRFTADGTDLYIEADSSVFNGSIYRVSLREVGNVGEIPLLLNNSGGESGDASGWTADAKLWESITGGGDYPLPRTGTRYFYAGSGSGANMYQDVDVSRFKNTIDQGLYAFEASFWHNTFEASEICNVRLSARDAGGAELASFVEYSSTGTQSIPNVWTPYSVRLNLPAGTRTVRVSLVETTHGGNSNDNYIDDISIKLVPIEGRLTSYNTPIGTGNRTGRITVTATNLSTGGGALTGLIDGTPTANNYWWNNGTGDGSGYLTFDFGTPQIIDELRLYQSNDAFHGTWVVEGSADNVAWAQVGEPFLLQRHMNRFGNPQAAAYRYYRLRHLSGYRASSPYVHEIEFKAAPAGAITLANAYASSGNITGWTQTVGGGMASVTNDNGSPGKPMATYGFPKGAAFVPGFSGNTEAYTVANLSGQAATIDTGTAQLRVRWLEASYDADTDAGAFRFDFYTGTDGTGTWLGQYTGEFHEYANATPEEIIGRIPPTARSARIYVLGDRTNGSELSWYFDSVEVAVIPGDGMAIQTIYTMFSDSTGWTIATGSIQPPVNSSWSSYGWSGIWGTNGTDYAIYKDLLVSALSSKAKAKIAAGKATLFLSRLAWTLNSGDQSRTYIQCLGVGDTILGTLADAPALTAYTRRPDAKNGISISVPAGTVKFRIHHVFKKIEGGSCDAVVGRVWSYLGW